jgi:Rne/Rng family ribonuclease
MARNTLVINCDVRETRVALIEDGVIAELHIERANARGTVGNVVLGKVTRVLPGMQAAFIEVGMDRAAFLHVEDLIRPDDFEAYLAGAHREDEGPSGKGVGGRRHHPESDADDDDDSEVIVAPGAAEQPSAGAHPAGSSAIAAASEPDAAEAEDAEAEDAEAEDAEAEDAEAEGATDAEADDADDDDAPDSDDGDSGPDSSERAPVAAAANGEAGEATAPGVEAGTSAVEHEPPPAGVAVEESTGRLVEDSQRRGRRRRRRRGRAPEPKAAPARREDPRKAAKNKGAVAKRPQLRVARTVPITEVVKEGDEVVVQISKEPIGTKGARVTSHISLPGRYVVYLPTVEHVGISKRIGSGSERQRLREVIDSMKPPQGGLIVRTVAEGLTKKQLKADVGYLVKPLGRDRAKKREGASARPTCLYSELDLVLKTARDLFTDDIEKIVIDDREEYLRLVRFVEMFMPERVKDIELYEGARADLRRLRHRGRDPAAPCRARCRCPRAAT